MRNAGSEAHEKEYFSERNMNFEDMYEIKGLIMKGSFAEAKKCVSSKTLQLFSVKEFIIKMQNI